MSLVSRLCRVLRYRNQSFSFLSSSSDNVQALSGAHLAPCTTFGNAYSSAHRGYGSRATNGHSSQFFGHSHVHKYGQSFYATGFRAMHGLTSLNYLQPGIYKDNTKKISECNVQGGSKVMHRFYSGGPVILSLISANVGVYAMWHNLDPKFMHNHFTVSIDNVVWRKRYHTLVTTAFSHFQLDHLLFNLFGLFCFGGKIESMYGGATTLSLYLAGAICGAFGHMLYGFYYPMLKKLPLQGYNYRASPAAMGASGAVTTLTLLYMLLFPNSLILMMFIPMPAALAGAIIIGVDVYRAIKGNTNISAASHLGGAWVAVWFYLILWLEGKIPT